MSDILRLKEIINSLYYAYGNHAGPNHIDDLCSEALKIAHNIETSTDGAYKERNQVVSALARCFPSGVNKTAIEGWDEAWHNCVYIDLPTGQASWHFHDREWPLFVGLPVYNKPWDGHSTPEKYRRLGELEKRREKDPQSCSRVRCHVPNKCADAPTPATKER